MQNLRTFEHFFEKSATSCWEVLSILLPLAWGIRFQIDRVTPSRSPCSSTSIGVAVECWVYCGRIYIAAFLVFCLSFHSNDYRALAWSEESSTRPSESPENIYSSNPCSQSMLFSSPITDPISDVYAPRTLPLQYEPEQLNKRCTVSGGGSSISGRVCTHYWRRAQWAAMYPCRLRLLKMVHTHTSGMDGSRAYHGT